MNRISDVLSGLPKVGMHEAMVFPESPEYEFPYYLGTDCAADIVERVAALEPDRVIAVADERVAALHGSFLDALGAQLRTNVVVVPPGEQAKNTAILEDVVTSAIEAGASRSSVIAAFGGGSTGNLAGLAAALLFRGIRLVHLPTTTIGAFDSVFSMKQAVNSARGKNQIGTYHVPTAVFVDTTWFNSLPPEVERGGWCEAAKNCLAIRPERCDELIELVGSHDPSRRWCGLMRLSLEAKMAVMAGDPFERRTGLTLEYGHTIGHAIEFATVDTCMPVQHGDAVALGMLGAARIARRLGLLPDKAVEQHIRLIGRIGAPTRLSEFSSGDRVMAAVLRDNKRGMIAASDTHVAMVLLEALGQPVLSPGSGLPLRPVSVADVEAALDELASAVA